MQPFILWQKVEPPYIFGILSNFKKVQIGYLDSYGNKVYYASYYDYEDIADDYEPEQEPKSGEQFTGSEWNRKQQRKYYKNLRENLNNSNNPEYTRPQHLADDIQFTSLQHHSPFTSKWVASKISQFQNTVRENAQRITGGENQQTKSKEISKGVIDKLSFHQEEELQEARNSYNILGQFDPSLELRVYNPGYVISFSNPFVLNHLYTSEKEENKLQNENIQPVKSKNINYVIVKDKQDIWNIAKYLLGNGASNTQINNLKDKIIKWNKLNPNGDINKGQRLIVSNPNQPLLIGKIGIVGEGEDSRSSIGRLPKGVLKLPYLSSNPKNNDQLPDEYFSKYFISVSQLATSLKINDKDWVFSENKIYEKFLSKKGGINVETYGIAKEMEKTNNFKKLRNQVSGSFMAQMIKNNGDYYKIDISNIKLPSFGSMKKPYLLAMVGGTQQLDVYLDNIIINGRNYTAKITLWLWDDYGVSEEDTVKDPLLRNFTIPINNALKSQWILQHNRGYNPIINGFKFSFTITGKF